MCALPPSRMTVPGRLRIANNSFKDSLLLVYFFNFIPNE